MTLGQILAERSYNGPKMDYVEPPTQDALRISQRHSARSQPKQPAASKDYERDMRNNQPIMEHHRRRREPDPPPDHDTRHYRNSKSTFPTFAGKVDPEAYFEWEKCMECVFDQHHYSEAKKVAVATSTFTEHALSWWNREVAERKRHKHYALDNWEDLKRQLRQRHVSRHYHRKLMVEFREIVQGNKTVEEYYEEFESLYNKVGLHTPEENLMTHFLDGLQERIASKVERYNHHDLPDLLQHALQVEQQVKRKKSTAGRTRTSEAHLISKPVDEIKAKGEQVSEGAPMEEVVNYPEPGELMETRYVPSSLVEHKPEEANLEEVTDYPELGELLETKNVHSPMVELEALQQDNFLVDAKVSDLNLDNGCCANVVSSSIVNRLQLTKLP